MLKMSLPEEVEAYKNECEKFIKEAETPENAAYWQKQAEECKELLTLFREMKMVWSDWARMKLIAELNRQGRINGFIL